MQTEVTTRCPQCDARVRVDSLPAVECVVRANQYGEAVLETQDGQRIDGITIKNWILLDSGLLVAQVICNRVSPQLKRNGDNIRGFGYADK